MSTYIANIKGQRYLAWDNYFGPHKYGYIKLNDDENIHNIDSYRNREVKYGNEITDGIVKDMIENNPDLKLALNNSSRQGRQSVFRKWQLDNRDTLLDTDADDLLYLQ